ncbi:MAG: dTMP kinase [Nanoarchaeota archaeon]|nr:dTMP kinase [Nanoarchaeota archaeon]
MTKNSGNSGKFIAFEGLDGSGSSTQVNMLADYFSKKGIKAHATKEPTNNLIGGLIRGQLTNHWKSSQICFQLLFSADRAHHLETEIEPSLSKGNVVITDRYMYSTFAFGPVEGPDMEWLEQINSKFRKPDLTILLKVPPKECVKRIDASRHNIELFEKEDKLTKVWANYEKIAKKYPNIIIIDGNRQKEDIHKDIINEVEKII